MKFPIFAYYKGKYHSIIMGEETALPSLAVILGSNGPFLYNKTNAYTVISEYKNQKFMKFDNIETKATFLYPIISAKIYSQTLAFLREVYKQHQSEGTILLTLNRNEPIEYQEYGIYIPEQETTEMSVKYEVKNLPSDTYLAGSIHSHPSFHAFQSSIDLDDEFSFDGIHVTLGHIDQEKIEIDERICLNGKVYTSETSLMETTENVESFPKEWLKKVKEESYTIEMPYHTIGAPWPYSFKQSIKDKIKNFWDMTRPKRPTNMANANEIKQLDMEL